MTVPDIANAVVVVVVVDVPILARADFAADVVLAIAPAIAVVDAIPALYSSLSLHPPLLPLSTPLKPTSSTP